MAELSAQFRVIQELRKIIGLVEINDNLLIVFESDRFPIDERHIQRPILWGRVCDRIPGKDFDEVFGAMLAIQPFKGVPALSVQTLDANFVFFDSSESAVSHHILHSPSPPIGERSGSSGWQQIQFVILFSAVLQKRVQQTIVCHWAASAESDAVLDRSDGRTRTRLPLDCQTVLGWGRQTDLRLIGQQRVGIVMRDEDFCADVLCRRIEVNYVKTFDREDTNRELNSNYCRLNAIKFNCHLIVIYYRFLASLIAGIGIQSHRQWQSVTIN